LKSRDLLPIGEVARRSGRRASAIRYYEDIGVLPVPVRVGGKRRYEPETMRTLAVIDVAQRAGLTLDEIRRLLDAPSGGSAAEQLRLVAERRLPELNARIERALMVQKWLEAAARCECPDLDACCLFEDRGSSRADRR
jgi:MerR family transcriptional regulator, redox-sensitive transcriptional activator SoxR